MTNSNDAKNDPRAYDLFGEERETPEGSRPCPVCGKIMEIETKEGIVVDVCKKHGIWLDTGEFKKILSNTAKKASKSKFSQKTAIGRWRLNSLKERGSRYHVRSNYNKPSPLFELFTFLFKKK